MIKRALKKALDFIAIDAKPASHKGMTDWEAIITPEKKAWEEAKRRADNGPRALLATSTGGVVHASVLEGALAVALTLRGAKVSVLLCDKVLPGCLRAEMADLPDPSVFEHGGLADRICYGCYAMGKRIFEPLGITVHTLGRLITDKERAFARDTARRTPIEQIPGYRLDNVAVGEHANAGVLRYFAVGDLSREPYGESALRSYFEAALLTFHAIRRLVATHDFATACFHHGIYIPQGIIGEVCRDAGVPVTNWNPSYRKNTFIFSHGDTYHHTMLDEPVSVWENIVLDGKAQSQIDNYLDSRRSGDRDWIWFHEKPDENAGQIAKQTGIDQSKPIIGLLTNVIWDAQLHYRANTFSNIVEWMMETIRYFGRRPGLQLLIRVHPAEVRGTTPSRQPMADEIKRAFPDLPENVFVIPPKSRVSTYAAMDLCDSVIIYGTKTGVELTSGGMPVIVAGEAWIRNKGFTVDASSPDEYFRILDSLPFGKKMASSEVTRAKKYAYHFFFRRMIPLSFMEDAASKWPPYELAISSLDDLRPGADPGLDIVCDGIMSGSPFVYPAERLGVHDD